MRFKDMFCSSDWCIAIRFNSKSRLFEKGGEELPFTVIKNSARYWRADPFLAKTENEAFVFAEVYDRLTRRGYIGVSKVDEKRKSLGKWRIVLKEKRHLSYPFVFFKNGSRYMIPESAHSDSLVLYEAETFPYKWKKKRILLSGVNWADTTLCENGGSTLDIKKNKVFQFDTDENFTPINIKELDGAIPEVSRRGGAQISRNGQLIDVFQDCTDRYGGGLIFRVTDKDATVSHTRLTEKDISVKGQYCGLHTYNALDGIEVIDLRQKNRFHILNPIGNSLFLFKKIARRILGRSKKRKNP